MPANIVAFQWANGDHSDLKIASLKTTWQQGEVIPSWQQGKVISEVSVDGGLHFTKVTTRPDLDTKSIRRALRKGKCAIKLESRNEA